MHGCFLQRRTTDEPFMTHAQSLPHWLHQVGFGLNSCLQVGTIEGRFGKSGKVKLRFENMQWHNSSDKAAEGDEMGLNKRPHTSGDNQVLLRYKRFVFDPDK